MISRKKKKECYFPQLTPQPLVVHHADYGIYSELRVSNVGGEAEVTAIIINDGFQPSVEIGGKEVFQPLALPRKLRFGASIAVLLQGPASRVRPEDCFKEYPKKVLVRLADGQAVSFGLWDIIREKG